MLTNWTSHLNDQEEIEKFRQSVQNSIVLDRLNDILVDMKKDQERVELSTEQYDKPQWDYRQAHRNGFVSCLSKIISLTNPDQRKSKS